MPEKCIVEECSNMRNMQAGIALNPTPFHGNQRTEAKKRRQRWIDFINLH